MSGITVGIAGITGRFARQLASALLKYPQVTIKGYCRDPSKVPQAISSKVSLAKGDGYDVSASRSFVTGCDVVVCCYLGDNELMVEGQKVLIDACAAEGIPRYVASDWAMDYTKLEMGQLFLKDPMIHVKAYLDAQDKVKGVHVLTGMLMDLIFSARFGVWDPASTTFSYWGTGNEIWEATSYQNAAEYTAAVCVDKDAVGIQKLVGGRASVREISDSFEKIYGVKPKLECQGSLDDLFKHMHGLQKNKPQDFLAYIFLFFQYYMGNGQTLIGPAVENDKYPQVKPVSWEDFLRAVPQDKLPSAHDDAGQDEQEKGWTK
ncbi:nmrA-like family protein [Hypoxylon sp. NC1633]|nr:nmrA-like family protein [Hypoxylon sp. NC1633]